MSRHVRLRRPQRVEPINRPTLPFATGQGRGTAAAIVPAHRQSQGFGQQAGPTQAPPAPTIVRFSIRQAIPVPPRGARPLRATADAPGVTWSLHTGTTAVDPGTTIAANGTITVGAAQTAGTIQVRATNSAGAFAFSELRFCGAPTSIASTSLITDAPAGDYGHVFDHVFDSSTGNVADLEGVGVGEQFPGLPNPTGATHAITAPTYPFGGTFTLHTATLTPDATNNWFLTAAGELGGNHDTVSIGQANIDVGRHVRSASNPTPAAALPAGFTVDQRLHWYNPLEANAANRWTGFVTVGHERKLIDNGGALSFETIVNRLSDGGDTYVGNAAVSGATANPSSVARSASAPRGAPAPAPNTVALSASTLPSPLGSGQSLTWSIRGRALGCRVAPDPSDPLGATLTVGTTAGAVTIRATAAGSGNFDEVTVTIT